MASRKILIRVLLILLAVVVVGVGLILGAAALLVGTERGAGFLVNRVVSDDLAIERSEGRLLGPLALYGVEYRTDAADVAIDRIELEWHPRRLLRRTVHVSALDVEGVTVRRHEVEPEEPEEEFELADIDLAFGLRLDRLRVADVRIHAPVDETAEEPAEPLEISEVLLSATAVDSIITLRSLEVRAPLFSADLAGRVVTQGGYPLDLNVRWTADLPDQPPLAGSGGASGSLAQLRVEHDLLEPIPARLVARATDVVENLRFEAELDIPRFALDVILPDQDPHEAAVQLVASGSPERITVAGNVQVLIQEIGELTGDLQLVYGNERVALDVLDLHLPATDGRLSARGDVLLAGETPSFDLNGDWSGLGWPLDAEPAYGSPQGTFAVAGTPESYDVSLEAAVDGTAAPAGRWTLAGHGTDTTFELQRLIGETLEGRLEGTGRFAWDPEVTWDLAVTGDGLNPGAMNPDWAGTLGLDLTTDGRIVNETMRANVQLARLDGTVQDMPLSARSNVSLAGERIDVRTLEARFGGASLRARGTVDQTSDLTWELEAPDLAEFSPFLEDAAGSFFAEGTVTGPRERPRITASLAGDSITVGENRVSTLAGVIDVDLAETGPWNVDIQADDVYTAALELADIRLNGAGTRADHELRLATDSPDIGILSLTLRGGLDEQRWSGAVDALDLDLVGIGLWELRQPAPLYLSADAAGLEDFCWAGARGGEICLDGTWNAETGGRGQLAGNDVPLMLVNSFLAADFEVDGLLQMAADAEVSADGSVLADARLEAGPGELRYAVGADDWLERPFEALRLTANATASELAADLAFELNDEDGVRGELRMPLGVEPEAQTLAGRIEGELRDRGLAGALSDALSDTDGLLRIDLTVAGTAADPEVVGSVALEEGQADVIPAGLQIRDIVFAATGDGTGAIDLDGSARSGDGEVALGGTFMLPTGDDEAWSADLAVTGERFEALRNSLARVVISPDLTVRAVPERIDVAGDVVIPEARISPEDLETAVPTSGDVIVIRDREDPEDPEELDLPVDVYANVRVVMGDDVQLDAFGLTGRLEGSLAVDQAPDRVPTGRGELQIMEGRYTAYRQTLEIDRGRLVFADGPVADPGLDVRVVRRPEQGILVGMDVRGTASTPQATLFSEPSMAESDVLAYLLIGRPVQQASQSEGRLLQNAATRAGLAGGEMIASRLGSALGLEEATLETGENGDLSEASLMLGTQISPRLYVGYGIGLFDAANILRIQYQLGRDWMVQTESGLHTGADLLYTVER